MQMSRYVGYSEAIDMINTIYNYQLQPNEAGQEGNVKLYKGETLRNVMTANFGLDKSKNSNVLEYYNKLLKDIQGIRSSDDGWFEKYRKKFAIYQLGANLKVMANQISALPTALRYIKPWNLIKGMATSGLGFIVDETKAPIEMQYRLSERTIVSAETLDDRLFQKVQIFGKGMELSDGLVVKMIWKACLMLTIGESTKLYKTNVKIGA